MYIKAQVDTLADLLAAVQAATLGQRIALWCLSE